jgi:hypothetical protein
MKKKGSSSLIKSEANIEQILYAVFAVMLITMRSLSKLIMEYLAAVRILFGQLKATNAQNAQSFSLIRSYSQKNNKKPLDPNQRFLNSLLSTLLDSNLSFQFQLW